MERSKGTNYQFHVDKFVRVKIHKIGKCYYLSALTEISVGADCKNIDRML